MFQPHKSRRAFEDISEQIRQAILSNQLSQGDRLPSERDLAEQFQVGRISIREALRNLEAIGLIQIRKGSKGGAFVEVADPTNTASLIMDRLQLEGTTHEQMIEARIGLERAVTEAAVRAADDRDLDRLQKDVERSKAIIESPLERVAIQHLTRFHILVAEASHNLPYVMFVRSIMEWAHRKLEAWQPGEDVQRYSYEAHKGIYEAIAARDTELAVELTRRHVVEMGDLVLQGLEGPGQQPAPPAS